MAPGDNGRTSLTLPNALGTGRGYFWRAKAQDGANTGPYSSMVTFNVFTPVSFDKPVPVSPVGGTKVGTYSPEFVFNNAPHAGSPGPGHLRHRGRDQQHLRRPHRGLAVRRADKPDEVHGGQRSPAIVTALLARSGVRSVGTRAMVGHGHVHYTDAGRRSTTANRRRRRRWRRLHEHDAGWHRHLPSKSVRRAHGCRPEPGLPQGGCERSE